MTDQLLTMQDTLQKNIVSAGLAKKCEIQVAYAIGEAVPVSINVVFLWYRKNSRGTGGRYANEK